MSIPKEIKVITIFLACVLLVSIIIKPEVEYKEYNCSDFETQIQSQKIFEQNENDIFHLDKNNNGIACEGLN